MTLKSVHCVATINSLEQELNRLGWYAATPEFWERFAVAPPQVAMLAPPLDTIPSIQGNAVYVLVERLAALLPFPCLILARELDGHPPALCPVSDRTLYYRGSLEPVGWESRLPHRVKKILFGTGAPALSRYPRAAGKALKLLDISSVIVEDVPHFCRSVHSGYSGDLHILLHQHIDAPVSTPPRHWKQIERLLDAVVFVAEQTRAATQTRHGHLAVPSQIIYNGVDLDHFDPARWEGDAGSVRTRFGISPDETVLLFVGRLIPAKGVLESAQAFVSATIPNAHFLIIGDFHVLHNYDAGYLASLQELAATHPQHLHLAGMVPQETLPAYYAAADAVIVPSLSSEGLPKVVTEALAMGLPTLATDRGGTWELLREGENGWKLTDPRDRMRTAAEMRATLTCRSELHSLRAPILAKDRPRMGEGRMVEEFTVLLHRCFVERNR